MTLGNFHNIETPTPTQIVTGNINPKFVILNIDNNGLAPSNSYQIVGEGQILYNLSQQESLNTAQFSNFNFDEEDEDEDEELEDDPDYIPESMVTGTVGEATEDEHGNLMWLVDFKLDFLSDIDKEEDRQESEQPERKKMKRSTEPVETQTTGSSEGKSGKSMSLMTSPLYSPAPVYHSLKPEFLPRQISTAKPNYTYTDLITLALRDKTSLTVSEIYQWISENFPYFRADDDRWKNSVRHNLSMNPHFRKGTKSKSGSGHVWVLAEEGGAACPPDGASPLKLISNEIEAAEAVRNILSGRHIRQDQRSRSSHPPQAGYLADPDSLQRSAEQILAGVKRPTAVESAVASAVQFVNGDAYLRQKQPVNLSTTTNTDYEITLYEHQSAALTLSSLDQIASSSSPEISCSQFLNLQNF